jgi:peptidoglycan/LPS O-acetylase OafA/YrhL
MSPKPAKGPHLTYRPGLDGLRALAVIGVFLYHAWPHSDGGPWLTGGFLGVDLFFVLSGYLITSILLIEWEHHRRIDLLRFWARRARRLFPAVVVVVLAALFLSAIFARDHLAQTRSDMFSSLFYFNNWHQIVANRDYFVRTGAPSLLQHFWSLAVEEQFYIVWPLVFVPGMIFLGRRYMPLAVIVGIVFSAGLMWILYDPANQSRVYYGTDTRMFLLLFGILLAFWWPYVERVRRALPVLELLGWAALGVTLYLFFNQQDFELPTDPVGLFHGGDVLAALCFAVLIAAVAHQRTIIGHAFGVAPLRWIGERSYGMYLWHWPIIVLTPPSGWWSGAKIIILQALLTVVAAALSYRFVEQPIRTGRFQQWLREFGPRRRRELVAAGAAALVVAFAVLFVAPSATSAQASSGPPRNHHHPHKKQHNPQPPHHPKHTKNVLPRGHMLAVGDSVMKGCEDDLRSALDHRVRVDADVARQIDQTIQELGNIRYHGGGLPKIVIIQVGNNGPLYFGGDIGLVALRHALRGVPDVIVVNDRNATQWETESNNAITEWLKGWPQAHLADWYHHSNESMLYPDHLHPQPWACKYYARVIKNALRGTHT